MQRTAYFIILFVVAFVPNRLAYAITPLRSILQLQYYQHNAETMVRVMGAKVVVADYKLIRNDFPEVKRMTNVGIDRWLIHHAAFISKPQADQTQVNTKIPVSNETVEAYRPPAYRRGIVFKTKQGLIDAKGTGSQEPEQRHHGNGLSTTGEAIREYIVEKAVSEILRAADPTIDTVKCYAVLDYGFDVLHGDGSKDPAGLVLRQAHNRASGALIHMQRGPESALHIEAILRKFGMTSCETGRGVDAPNLQTSEERALVDFGTFHVRNRFKNPVIKGNAVDIIVLKADVLKEAIAWDPSKPDYIQPDSDFRLPINIWGGTISHREDPRFDNVWILSHDLSRALQAGQATRQDVQQHLRSFSDPIESAVKAFRTKPCSQLLLGTAPNASSPLPLVHL